MSLIGRSCLFDFQNYKNKQYGYLTLKSSWQGCRELYVLGGFEVEDGADDGVDLHSVADIGNDFIGWLVDHRRLIACEIIDRF